MGAKKRYVEPRSSYAGIIENKYLDFIKQEAAKEERSLNTTINRIIKKYCQKKYGKQDGLKK